MVSSTQQTERRRARNKSRQGRANARQRTKLSSPKFPIHPEGYDTNAPDAKKS